MSRMAGGLDVRGSRLVASAATLVVLSSLLSACASLVLPDREQLRGDWVNVESGAEINLAQDGTCQVAGLPRGVEDGMGPPYGEPYSTDCTWHMGSGTDDEQAERGATTLTISFVEGGGMTVSILRGPKLGIREGTGGRFFEFERALL